MSRAVAFTIIVILIVGGAMLLFRRSDLEENIPLTAENIALTGHHADGSPAWSLQAQTGALNEDSGELESVELTFFRDSNPHIIVAGDLLSRGSSGSSMTGDIHIEQAGNLSMETDAIFWDERNKILESGPVTIEMGTASIAAGGFHHNLDTDVTTLTQGIEARLAQGTKDYSVSSDTAEATADHLLLVGDVSIQESGSGDHYSCQQLESDSSGTSIRLTGDVSGTWSNSGFSAGMVQLNDAGVRMKGNVTIDLELKLPDEPNDA
jgi:hypothetical protein